MGMAKQEVRKILDRVSDDASFEEIQYHIYVREKIGRGLEDVRKRRGMSQGEVERRMLRWLGKYPGRR